MVNIAFQTLYRFKQPRTIPRRNLVCYLHLHLCIPPLVNHDPETSLFSRTGIVTKVHVCKSEFPLKLPRRMWYGWNRVSFLPTTMAKSGPEFCSKYPKNHKVHTHTHTHRQTDGRCFKVYDDDWVFMEKILWKIKVVLDH